MCHVLQLHRFLNTHGSHVITAVTFGASIDQYAFAEQSSSYTARDFTVKACASLAKNITVSSISVSACSTVTSEEIHKVLPSYHTTCLCHTSSPFVDSLLCKIYKSHYRSRTLSLKKTVYISTQHGLALVL